MPRPALARSLSGERGRPGECAPPFRAGAVLAVVMAGPAAPVQGRAPGLKAPRRSLSVSLRWPACKLGLSPVGSHVVHSLSGVVRRSDSLASCIRPEAVLPPVVVCGC